jgi:hypothetical protein
VPSGYRIVNLGSFGGTKGINIDINSRGAMVGASWTTNNLAENAFLWLQAPPGEDQLKNAVCGGPRRAIAFGQADAGLPDTTFFISVTEARPSTGSCDSKAQERSW